MVEIIALLDTSLGQIPLLPDLVVDIICQQLFYENDYKTLYNLIFSNTLKRDICQKYLSKLKPIIKGQKAHDILQQYHLWVTHNDRTRLCSELKKYWVGKTNSNIGIQYVSINWNTRKMNHDYIGRDDIYVISFRLQDKTDHYNIFVDRNLRYSINDFDITDKKLFNHVKPYLDDFINCYLSNTDKAYIERQRAWFKQKPFTQLINKTPEEAVEILEQTGWC
jgi:hypothetical protein